MGQELTLHWQERRLDRTLLRTYRDTVDLFDVFPNEKQPRMGPKVDPELQRQIEANEGIFEPLLLEPHPDNREKYRIVDGDRRWTNSKVLVEVHKKEEYRRLPAEITDRTLTEEERLRVWIYIHRQRREWDTKEKEMVAYPNRRARGQSPGNIGPTSAHHVPFSLHISSRHAPQPLRSIVPIETPGPLLEGLRCLTASRPLPTPNEFQGKTMPRLLLITDSRLSENDRQNVFLEELTVGPQLYPRSLLELGQDLAQSFSCALPDEVWA